MAMAYPVVYYHFVFLLPGIPHEINPLIRSIRFRSTIQNLAGALTGDHS
jgi:hypothetical protein